MTDIDNIWPFPSTPATYLQNTKLDNKDNIGINFNVITLCNTII
jgi:hypothetical protein